LFADLLSAAIQTFIRQHALDDTSQLVLKLNSFHGVPMSAIAEQIMGRKKAKEKLPMYYRTNAIVYPPGLNLEQSSSEHTARFKSTFVLDAIPQKDLCADLTGGFGVDSFFFSKAFKQVYYIEPNKDLLEIVQHNHQQLAAKEIKYFNTSAEEFLKSCKQSFDCIYIDPSRRSIGNKKVFSFADCEPDVTSLQQKIFEKTSQLLIKSSPLLDIQQALKDLLFVKRIFVISVENECKELLFLCEQNFADEPTIEAINLLNDNTHNSFTFQRSAERAAKATYSEPLAFIYEPNASVLKAGAFKLISTWFKIEKLHPSTHLYTADKLVPNFPGKSFKIVAHVKPNPKTLKEFFPQGQANLTTRNYPLTVKELRNKTRLQDGGEKFLIGFSGIHKKFLVVAEKVS